MERPLSAQLLGEVAARAGVSRPTVYKHVGDQAAIVRAVIGREAERYTIAILPELGRPMPLRRRFSHLVAFSVQYFRSSPLIRAIFEHDGDTAVQWLHNESPAVLREGYSRVVPLMRQALPGTRTIPLEETIEWGLRLTFSIAFMPSPTRPLETTEDIERHVDRLFAIFDSPA